MVIIYILYIHVIHVYEYSCVFMYVYTYLYIFMKNFLESKKEIFEHFFLRVAKLSSPLKKFCRHSWL